MPADGAAIPLDMVVPLGQPIATEPLNPAELLKWCQVVASDDISPLVGEEAKRDWTASGVNQALALWTPRLFG